ncbi:Ppx/GppA phosphatase family protein [Gleimia hominis]|uniref:Ppx/GppA phosphatase family protein n=1 Tax=Gleimia hominis TaxID=595468 RepID=A0ABU3IBU2_9ACTO|nr:Ppx/GppA phosphatase family protein [Gleimia hominis]MDT3767848.1 Ppx/GppA phosphatase family protein [Gleimia hominis]
MSKPIPVAAVDCGTNTIRLLVGYEQRGKWHDLERTMQIVRLGEGVDQTGYLSEAAIERTVAAARQYAHICRHYGVDPLHIRCVATSASRDAKNAAEFKSKMREVLGVTPEVIEGQEEARLSYAGALSTLRDAAEPALVVDIGGGSTEFVVGDHGQVQAVSTNMGSVRVTERLAAGSGIKFVDDLLREADDELDFSRVRTVIGVAGTVTTIAAHALDLSEYEPQKIHGSVHSVEQMLRSCAYMIDTPVEQKAQLGYMAKGRADVIGGGALIWRAIVRRLETRAGTQKIIVSENDILDGVALSLVHADSSQ